MDITWMADTVGGNPAIRTLVAAKPPKIAYYVTGYTWTSQEIGLFPDSGHVRIDQSPDLEMYATGRADVADIESGAGSAKALLAAIQYRTRGIGLNMSSVYVNRGNWTSLMQMTSAFHYQVRWWLADPSLNYEQASYLISEMGGRVAAVQWAWPSTNPRTLIPGTDITLESANIDLSAVHAEWFLPR